MNSAKVVLDGTNIVVKGYEKGNFIGPTIITDVNTEQQCYKEEVIFIFCSSYLRRFHLILIIISLLDIRTCTCRTDRRNSR